MTTTRHTHEYRFSSVHRDDQGRVIETHVCGGCGKKKTKRQESEILTMFQMPPYPKINSLWKRHADGPLKGRIIPGEYARPEFELLADLPWLWTEKVDGTNIRLGWDSSFTPADVNSYIAGRTDNGSSIAILGGPQLIMALDGAAVYAVWPAEVTNLSDELVDRKVWTPIKRSTYLKLVEDGKLEAHDASR